MSTASALDLSPSPGAASSATRWRAQAGLEFRLLMTNGEQLLLTLVIPVVALVALTWTGLADVNRATPGVMALAVLSSAFTATAIATGFERRSGVLKFLGSTPLGRSGLLVGKVAATLAVIVIQMLLMMAVASALGWDPVDARPVAATAVVALGTAALGAWGFALAGLLRAEATLAIANAIFLLLMVAGGTVAPADDLPGPLPWIIGALPSAALGDGLRATLGAGPTGVPWADLALLAGWAAAGLAVTVRTFRWE